MERLFPRLTRDGQEQASFSAKQSGIGSETASDVARLAHLGWQQGHDPKRELCGFLRAEPLLHRVERLVNEPPQPSFKLWTAATERQQRCNWTQERE